MKSETDNSGMQLPSSTDEDNRYEESTDVLCEMDCSSLLELGDSETNPRLLAVRHGSEDAIRVFAQHWVLLQRLIKQKEKQGGPRITARGNEGVLFHPSLYPVNEQYREGEHWSVQSRLGAGTFGKCYYAVDNTTEFVFAVKKVSLENFRAGELVCWAGLHHPNINPCFGAVRQDRDIFIFMRLVIGENVRELMKRVEQESSSCWGDEDEDGDEAGGEAGDGIRREEPVGLPEKQALNILKHLLNALDWLQQKRLVHTDVKADNVLVEEETGRVLLIDFGLCAAVSEGKEYLPGGMEPQGTENYMSPEMARSEEYNWSTDVWSAACSLLHMLTGRDPWSWRYADTLIFLIGQGNSPLDDLETLDNPPELADAVKDLLRLGLEVEKRNRSTAQHLQQRIHDLLLEETYDSSDGASEESMELPQVEEEGLLPRLDLLLPDSAAPQRDVFAVESPKPVGVVQAGAADVTPDDVTVEMLSAVTVASSEEETSMATSSNNSKAPELSNTGDMVRDTAPETLSENTEVQGLTQARCEAEEINSKRNQPGSVSLDAPRLPRTLQLDIGDASRLTSEAHTPPVTGSAVSNDSGFLLTPVITPLTPALSEAHYAPLAMQHSLTPFPDSSAVVRGPESARTATTSASRFSVDSGYDVDAALQLDAESSPSPKKQKN